VYSNAVHESVAPIVDWNEEPSRAEVFGQIDTALYTTDADGWLTYYNDAAADLWGYRPELTRTRWCGSWRIYQVDGTPLPLDQCPMAVAMKQGREVRGARAVLERPDGTLIPFAPFPTPLRDASGKVVAGVNMLLTLPSLAVLSPDDVVVDTSAILAIKAAMGLDGDGSSAVERGDVLAARHRARQLADERRAAIRMHVRQVLQTLSVHGAARDSDRLRAGGPAPERG
jgi:hypothetical protein